MTTVIDSLVLEFGLDNRNFTKGQREVLDQLRMFEGQAKSYGDRTEQSGKRIVDVMASFRREAIGALGLFLGGRGVKEFVGYMTQLDATTGKTAQTLNMSARELSAWQGVMEQSGGSAESMNSALQGMTSDMNKFMLTGQGTLATVLRPLGISLFDNNKQLKSAGQLMLELADATKGMDPARAAAFLQMIPGANADSISLMLRGRREMEEMLKTAQQLGGTTGQSAEAAKKYQQEVANLERSMTSLGRSMLSFVMPALQGTINLMTAVVSGANMEKGSPEQIELHSGSRQGLVKKFGSPGSLMRKIGRALPEYFGKAWLEDADKYYGPEGADEASEDKIAAAGKAKSIEATKTNTAAGSVAEMEAYIRQAAIARKIDPDTAVAVARKEGMFKHVGDRGSSFGPFQLHYGGVASGGMAVKGLGDDFTKKTGLDARNESTWKQQVDFSLDRAGKVGWGEWHGWKGAQFHGIGGRGGGGSNSTSTVTVGNVNVYTQATDAKGIAADIKPQLERGSFTSQFNSGLE